MFDVAFAEPVRVHAFVSDNDIVPEEDQQELLYYRDKDKDGSFRAGDIANKLVSQHAAAGTKVSKTRVYIAVGRFFGKARTTILYYAQVAAKFSPEERDRYPELAFCHFAYAAEMGSRSREVLEYASSKPYITTDDLRDAFAVDLSALGSTISDVTAQEMRESFTNALSASSAIQSDEDAYKRVLVNLYSLKDELVQMRANLTLTKETLASVDDILSELSSLLPRVAMEIGVRLTED